MRNKKQNITQTILIALVSVFIFYIFNGEKNGASKNESNVNGEREIVFQEGKSFVKRAVDGDTVELENGQNVRYIGIDTPETVHPNKGVECFGKEASEKNRELVEGKEVRLEKDVSNTDRYGRILRYVWVDELFINLELVRQGYAHVSTYPPDVKYQAKFLEAQKYARENKMGLWGECSESL